MGLARFQRTSQTLTLGDYYLGWYVGPFKRLRSIGSDPKKALKKLEKQRLELAYVAAGGEVKHSDVPLDGDGQRKGSVPQSRIISMIASTAKGSRATALLRGLRRLSVN